MESEVVGMNEGRIVEAGLRYVDPWEWLGRRWEPSEAVKRLRSHQCAYSNTGKKQYMDEFVGTSLYVALFLTGGTELSGFGYARKALSSSLFTVSSAGVATLDAALVLFSAIVGAGQNAQQPATLNLMNASTGGSAIYSANVALTGVTGAPTNGQAVELSTLTLNP